MTDEHKPRMSPDQAQKLREWQNHLYSSLKNQQITTVNFLGRTFVVPPNVHMINPMSDLIGNSILQQIKSNDRVLDMGTGCGVNAILAAAVSNEVVAVDINQIAIDAAKENARRNGVAEKISFSVSDLFDSVKGTFDLIVFDPPFRWFKPRGICEVSTTDEGYKSLTKFFENVHSYLKPNGRMLICFGSSGDLAYLYELIERAGFTKEVIAHRDMEKEGIKVDYYTFLVTRK
ncbi:MAG: methyltransferase [Oligoflexia bacterium]|nr:methyltransferase [Oligoflexia bacterium]